MLTIKDFRKPQATWDADDPLVYTPSWGGDSPFPIWRVGSCTFYPQILENELISSSANPEEFTYTCTHCCGSPSKTREPVCGFCCGAGVTISYSHLRSIVNGHP